MTRIVVQKSRQQGQTLAREKAKAFKAGFAAGLFEAHDMLLKSANGERATASLFDSGAAKTHSVLHDLARTLSDRAKQIQVITEYDIDPDDVEPGSENENPRSR